MALTLSPPAFKTNNIMKNKKIKIQIKSILGKLLFEFETESNTIAKTVSEAVKSFR